jgi:polypeptide N-acetylgalactosaminyltransferase
MLHKVLKRCLAVHPQNNQLTLLPCDTSNRYHQWVFKEIQPK